MNINIDIFTTRSSENHHRRRRRQSNGGLCDSKDGRDGSSKLDSLNNRNDNHKKSPRKLQDKTLRCNPTKKGSTSSTSQSTISRSRSSERKRKGQQKKNKKKNRTKNKTNDVRDTRQSSLVVRHDDDDDDDDDDSSIGVPVIGEFILEVETFRDDPFANSDLKLPEPKPKRADRFRKERIDKLLTTMKKEHSSSKRSLQDIDILNDDHQQSSSFIDGHYQTTSTKDLKSQMAKISSSTSSIRSLLNTTSGSKNLAIEIQKKQSHMHDSTSSITFSKRTKERIEQSKKQNISKDRRSSVRDSLSYYLESLDKPIHKKEQRRDAVQLPVNERRKNPSRSSRSVSSCPGVMRKKDVRVRSRSRPRSRRPMLGPKDSKHSEVEGLAQSCRKLNLAF